MKKIAYLLVVAGLLCFNQAFADNLLTNSSFDTGSLSPWVEISGFGIGSDVSITAGQFLSPDYSAQFKGSNRYTDATLSLTQGLFTITPGTTYYTGAYLESLSSSEALRGGANAYILLKWYSNSFGNLGEISSDKLTAANDAWELFEASATAPSNAKYATISLVMYSPKLSGTSRSVYFDNAYFGTTSAVPEPISTVLFIAGGSVLLARRIRKGRK